MESKKLRSKPRVLSSSDEPSLRRSLVTSDLQSILNAFPANVVLLDRKGAIRYTNDAWRRFGEQYGMPSDSCGIGLNYLKLCRNGEGYLGRMGPSVANSIQRLWEGKADEFYHEHAGDIAATGYRLVVHGRVVTIGRSATPYVLLTLEATAKQIMNAIEWCDTEVKQLPDSPPFVPWEADAETRRFRYVGPQVEALLGYPQASWYEPQFWISNLHAEDRARTTKAYRELSKDRSHYELLYRMVAKNGRTVWLRDFITVEIGGSPSRRMRGFLVDVTTSMRLEQRGSALQMLSESMEEIFWFVALNPERLLYIGAVVEKVMGWKPEKFLQDPGFWLQCVHEEDRRRVQEAYGGWLNGSIPEYKLEFRFRLPDGRIRWMADYGALLYDQKGRIEFATGIARDITAQKQAQEDLRRLSGQLISAQEEERKRLARDLHDHVSQALTLLSLEVEQVTRLGETTLSQREILAAMHLQLQSLSSDLHALSHQLHPSKLKHLGLVSAIRAMCREAGRGDLTVNFSDKEVPRQLPDDVSLTLYRVMQEGLQNVRKHSGARSVDAELRRTSSELLLRLRDQGKGFDPKSINAGYGLGLLSMKERLNSVRGTLIIQSAPGQGTVLEARVPLDGDGTFQ